MLKLRKIKFFLRDFYLFLIFFDKDFSNILNYLKAFINKEQKFIFRKNGNFLNLDYLELIKHINLEFGKNSLIKGNVLTDVSDYKKFNIDFENKNILDVGSWIGDGILFFHKLGANRIIAYEPIKENVEFATKIIKKFGINCKIYDYAVCKEDGGKEFWIDKRDYGGVGLGLLESNQKIYMYR